MADSIWSQAASLPDSQQSPQPSQQKGSPAPTSDIWSQAAGMQPGQHAPAPSGHAPGFMDDVRDSVNFLGDEIHGFRTAIPQMAKGIWNGTEKFNHDHPVLSAIPGASVIAPMVKSAWDATEKPASEAAKDLKNGDYGSAVPHLLGSVPLLSPVSDAYDQYQAGDMKGLANNIGNTAGQVVAGKLAPEVAPGVASAASDLKGAWKNFTKVDPGIAAIKAWSPTPTEYGFTDRMPETLAQIQNESSTPIKTNTEAIKAAEAANSKRSSAFEKWMAPARKNGVTISGDDWVKAAQDNIPETMKSEHPEQAKAIIDNLQNAYGGKNFTVDQVENFRKNKTSDLKSFYDSNTGNKIAALSDGTTEAMVKGVRDSMADSLYKALDPLNGGAGPRSIRLSQSDILDILDAARRRDNVAQGSKPVSKISAVAGAVPKAIQAVTSGPGVGYMKAGDLANPKTLFSGSVDPWIEKAFKAAGKPSSTSLPMPPLFGPGSAGWMNPNGPSSGGIAPAGWVSPKGLLGAPRGNTIQNPLPFSHQHPDNFPDTETWSTITGRPAVTPATNGYSPEMYGPDGMTSHPGDTYINNFPKGPYGNRLLTAGSGFSDLFGPKPKQLGPASMPPTQNGIGSRFGDAVSSDLVPFKHPITGKTEYVPKWMLDKKMIK